jgi:YVTN family beta-propeller protein
LVEDEIQTSSLGTVTMEYGRFWWRVYRAIRRARLPVILVALEVACSSATGPSGATHPAGIVFATPALPGEPYGVAVSPSGDVLVAQVLPGLVTSYQLPDTTPVASILSGLQPVHVAIDPAGSRAYVINQAGQFLHVINLDPLGVVDSLPLTNDGFNVAVAPAGQRHVTTADGRVYVVSTATVTFVDSMRVGSSANGLAFSPSGDRLYVSSRDSGTVTVFDALTDAPVDTITTTGAPQRPAVTPDGTTLFAANETYGVSVVALPAGTLQPNIDRPLTHRDATESHSAPETTPSPR